MDIDAFRSARRQVDDIAKELPDAAAYYETVPAPGFIYPGNGVIEIVTETWPKPAREKGRYHLCIGNMQWIENDLQPLEQRLYEYATSEGLI